MSVPWIGARPPAPEPIRQATEYDAICDQGCGNVARWRAVASIAPDHTRTRVEYVVECPCTPPAEKETA